MKALSHDKMKKSRLEFEVFRVEISLAFLLNYVAGDQNVTVCQSFHSLIFE